MYNTANRCSMMVVVVLMVVMVLVMMVLVIVVMVMMLLLPAVLDHGAYLSSVQHMEACFAHHLCQPY